MKQREYAYDNLKFLLIIFVIAAHFSDFYTGLEGDGFLELTAAARGMYGAICIFVMPAFVFVSGLFAKSALSDRSRALKKVGEFLLLYVLCKVFLGLPSMILRRTLDFNLFSESGIPWFMLCMAWWFLATWILKRFILSDDLRTENYAGAQTVQNPPQIKKCNTGILFAGNVALACILGYTNIVGDFLCLSKMIVFYPFFLAGYCLDAKKLIAGVQKPVHRIVGMAGLLLLLLTAVLQPDFLYALRPILNGRGNAYALAAENFTGIFAHFVDPAFGAFWRLAYYAAAAFMIYCLLAVIPRKKLPTSVFGSRTLQVYFLHYIFLYPLKIVPVVEKMQALLPTWVCVIFILAVSAGLAALLSLRFVTAAFNRVVRLGKA